MTQGPLRTFGGAVFAGWLVLATMGCSGPEKREGTIVYRDPVVRGTLSQRQHRAVTQIYTTADDELRSDSPNVQVHSGTLPPSASGAGSAGTLARRMFQRMSQQVPVRLLSTEQFGDLWGRLETAGLFQLPPARLARPPKDRAYFHVKTKDRQWIIARPAPPTAKEDSEGRENARRWQLAETALVMFENDI
jgi:hypothetical protein